MRMILLAFLIVGCAKAAPPMKQNSSTDTDMLQYSDMAKIIHGNVDGGSDMSHTTDMAGNMDMVVAADMDNMSAPDMTPLCSNGTTLCNGLCVDEQYDHDNCGGCGIVCDNSVKAACLMGACSYEHHDTFCSDWFSDGSATVSGSNSTQALEACNACYKTTLGITGTCSAMNGSDSMGHNWEAYGFALSDGSVYRLYYLDTFFSPSKVGYGDIGDERGYTNLLQWVQ